MVAESCFRGKRSWQHDVSAKWLMARRGCLTASEVKNLVADYKRIKSGKIVLYDALQFAKVYGSKMSGEIDTSSFGPAARGHIMEPYAVEEYNRVNGTSFHTWDDKIVTMGNMGFSPDAMDVPEMPGVMVEALPSGGLMMPGRLGGTVYDAPRRILEIKSYDAGNGFQRLSMVDRGELLDERWQVAMAMHVCSSIEEGTLLFYLPQCGFMFEKRYGRADLAYEIETIGEIGDMWSDYSSHMAGVLRERSMATEIGEDEIYSDYMKMNDALSI